MLKGQPEGHWSVVKEESIEDALAGIQSSQPVAHSSGNAEGNHRVAHSHGAKAASHSSASRAQAPAASPIPVPPHPQVQPATKSAAHAPAPHVASMRGLPDVAPMALQPIVDTPEKKQSSLSSAVSLEKPVERRTQPRFRLEFRVILVCGTKSFRTHTSNISLGGMQVKNKVPAEMFNQACRVFVGSPDLNENIEFDCVLLGDKNRSTSLKFVQCNEVAISRLKAWIKQVQDFHGRQDDKVRLRA